MTEAEAHHIPPPAAFKAASNLQRFFADGKGGVDDNAVIAGAMEAYAQTQLAGARAERYAAALREIAALYVMDTWSAGEVMDANRVKEIVAEALEEK